MMNDSVSGDVVFHCRAFFIAAPCFGIQHRWICNALVLVNMV